MYALWYFDFACNVLLGNVNDESRVNTIVSSALTGLAETL